MNAWFVRPPVTEIALGSYYFGILHRLDIRMTVDVSACANGGRTLFPFSFATRFSARPL
jgi:hypothetical protein